MDASSHPQEPSLPQNMADKTKIFPHFKETDI